MPQPLKELFPSSSDAALDLLDKLLKFDPSERITAADAIKHPYFAEYDEYADEDFPDKENKFDSSVEDPTLTEKDLLGMIYHEVSEYHKDIFADPD